jgi:electron transport complex protein RnfG
LCGLLIVATNVNTLARIRHNQEILMRESVANSAGDRETGRLSSRCAGRSHGSQWNGRGRAQTLRRLRRIGPLPGNAIEAGARGYADVISAMYAYSPEAHAITGFRVVEMRETPGLGDRVGSDPEFLRNFQKLDATHPIEVVKHGKKKNAGKSMRFRARPYRRAPWDGCSRTASANWRRLSIATWRGSRKVSNER